MNTRSRSNGYLPASAFSRRDRLVIGDSGYYYRTREEGLVGPFPTQSTANFELNIFIHIKEIEQELLNTQHLEVA